MKMFLGELIGTMLLLLLGDGVVAAVVLQRTKATGAGWIVIAFGWAMAVFVGVFCVAKYCDAHLNPAVTIAMVTAGRMAIGPAMVLIVAQFLGAMIGSGLVYLMYR
jgi:glycerol uptake facilitator protein